MLFSTAAQTEDMHMQELERKLEFRDKTIIELIERVEALEKRIGVQRVTKDTTVSQKPEVTSNSKIDLAQAPGAVVVEEGAAERALERSLTREGAVLLSPGVLEMEPSFNFTRREDSAPGFVTMDEQVFASKIERNANSLTSSLGLRLGLPWSSQLELGLPYRWNKVESVTNINFVPTTVSRRSDTGFGDFRIGIAKTLLREGLWRPDLVGRFTWDTDSGDADSFDELRVSLTAIKRQAPVTFIGGLSYQHTFENGQIKPGSTLSANFGSLIALSPETSLRFFIATAYQNETELSGRKIKGSDRTIGTFVIGGSTLIAPGTLLNLSAGIGLTDDADDFSLTLSMPIRFDERLF